MAYNDVLSTRALGQYPISIATSLALEAAFDIYPDRPEKGYLPILKYDELWINLRTLFRNIMGALNKDSVSAVIPPSLALAMAEEIDMITSIVGEGTNGKVKVVFYYSNYAHLETHFKHALIRMDNTDKQKEYTAIHNQTIKFLLTKHKEEPIGDIRLFDLWIETKVPVKALIITNYAIDLLSSKQFSKLTLLETHSGHFKEPAQWYTKYYDKDLSQIPFRRDLIQIFGDSTIFRPMDIKLRRDIIEIAKKYHWSSVTTSEKVRYGIDQLQNQFFRDTVKQILTNN